MPGWKLLAIQWLVLGSLILLFGLLLLQGKWQQLAQTEAEQQRLTQQMSPLWEQLARMPTLEQVNQDLQQVARQPVAEGTWRLPYNGQMPGCNAGSSRRAHRGKSCGCISITAVY
ncbi:Uncharacterised protein [Serratia proteamaculans]|nr:Uncharacterised protein [Serratia proteamaculans]